MADTMLAVVKARAEENGTELRTVPVPEPGPDDVAAVLNPRASGDLHDAIDPCGQHLGDLLVGQDHAHSFQREELLAVEEGQATARDILEIDLVPSLRAGEDGGRLAVFETRRRSDVHPRVATLICRSCGGKHARFLKEVAPLLGKLDVTSELADRFR